MQLYPSNQGPSNPFYNLAGLLGNGKNLVTIYKATSPGSSTTLAVKLFSKKKGEDPSPHYLQEEKIITALSHPNILRYHAFYPAATYKAFRTPFKDCSAIVMEYLPHGDLFNFVSKKPCSEKLARTFFIQMLSALEYLHQEGIAHLDLKPENFLVSFQGLKLIDFDFSHKIDDKITSGMKGTPGFRAPEWVKQAMKDFKAADIFSLGVTLFTIVVGWAPFEEIEKERDVFEFDHHYKTLRSDSGEFWKAHGGFLKQDGREDLSSELKDLIEGMIQEDPEKRVSMSEIKKHSWLKGDVYETDELEAQIKLVLTE